MITCTRRIVFDAGHRICGHENLCKYLHGHRYVIEATFLAKEIDSLGRVIDFGVVKKILGKWVDENLDHTLILWKEDKELADSISKITQQTIYFLDKNPSAENIAIHLLHDVCPKLFTNGDVKCIKIKLHESENNFVEVKAST